MQRSKENGYPLETEGGYGSLFLNKNSYKKEVR
jgi:hypothetical protein